MCQRHLYESSSYSYCLTVHGFRTLRKDLDLDLDFTSLRVSLLSIVCMMWPLLCLRIKNRSNLVCFTVFLWNILLVNLLFIFCSVSAALKQKLMWLIVFSVPPPRRLRFKLLSSSNLLVTWKEPKGDVDSYLFLYNSLPGRMTLPYRQREVGLNSDFLGGTPL